jgi:hypothetical protein
MGLSARQKRGGARGRSLHAAHLLLLLLACKLDENLLEGTLADGVLGDVQDVASLLDQAACNVRVSMHVAAH